MSLTKTIAALTMAVAFAVPTLLPATAAAQGRSNDRRDERRPQQNRPNDRRNDKRESDRRQQTKNQWRNLGIAGGAVGVYGLLSGNKTLAALGIGGGLYSASRYEADRKSQNREGRNRYELFNRSSFDHAGHHYERKTRSKNGQKYYYFQRTR